MNTIHRLKINDVSKRKHDKKKALFLYDLFFFFWGHLFTINHFMLNAPFIESASLEFHRIAPGIFANRRTPKRSPHQFCFYNIAAKDIFLLLYSKKYNTTEYR